MTINSICVCGAGTMGAGIAQVVARSGYATLLFDLNLSILDKARTGIELSLQTLTDKGKISQKEKQSIFSRIHFTNDLQSCLADVFIEAIIEKPEAKIALFNQLAEMNHSESIFASNTSSLSLTGIAQHVKNPERMIGLHFFNPAPIMKLVEIVTTEYTNTQTLDVVRNLASDLEKTAVICKDSPGFIVNRVARPYYIEALRLAEEGIADFKQIDRLMENAGFKMGPFKLMDLIGNDVNYSVSCSVYEQLNQPERLRPSPIQEGKVAAGELGKKTGKGYYEYK